MREKGANRMTDGDRNREINKDIREGNRKGMRDNLNFMSWVMTGLSS